MALTQTLTCTKCGATAPRSEFPLVDRERGWRRHECRQCNYERVEKWHADRYPARRAQQIEYHERAGRAQRFTKLKTLQYAVYAAYGDRCRCCGERERGFLTIDHVNSDGKVQRGERHPKSPMAFLIWIIENGFPADLQVLCYNCNLGRARHHGVCPHQAASTTIPQGSTTEAIAVGSASHPYPAFAGLLAGDEIVWSRPETASSYH
jgi:hypothetical protein